MNSILPVFYIIILFSLMLVGLVLLAVGILLLLKFKYKLAGAVTAVTGAVFTLFPLAVLLALIATPRLLS